MVSASEIANLSPKKDYTKGLSQFNVSESQFTNTVKAYGYMTCRPGNPFQQWKILTTGALLRQPNRKQCLRLSTHTFSPQFCRPQSLTLSPILLLTIRPPIRRCWEADGRGRRWSWLLDDGSGIC